MLIIIPDVYLHVNAIFKPKNMQKAIPFTRIVIFGIKKIFIFIFITYEWNRNLILLKIFVVSPANAD